MEKIKNIIMLVGILTISVLMGCGTSSSGNGDTVILISEEVTSVTEEICNGGGRKTTTLDEEHIEDLKEWISNLQLKQEEFKEGDTPGDVTGGESYIFTLTGGDISSFSYITNGERKGYLLVDDVWYSVLNPSNPLEK